MRQFIRFRRDGKALRANKLYILPCVPGALVRPSVRLAQDLQHSPASSGRSHL